MLERDDKSPLIDVPHSDGMRAPLHTYMHLVRTLPVYIFSCIPTHLSAHTSHSEAVGLTDRTKSYVSISGVDGLIKYINPRVIPR